jgi:glutaredoxin 3
VHNPRPDFSPRGVEEVDRVIVYSTGTCPICDKAKAALERWRIPFREVRIDLDRAARREFSQVTNGARTVPQIVIDGRCIGGFSELTELHMEGALDGLAKPPTS